MSELTATADLTRTTRSPARWIVVAVVALLSALVVSNLARAESSGITPLGEASRITPQSAAIEDALGLRFSRVAVVADGGLITVSYVVLDAEKAARFQADAAHAPVLESEARDGSTTRVSLMKHGHDLRAGETYYLVYENTAGALRSGELVSIDVGTLGLAHFPVL